MITIYGQVPSKKNSRNLFVQRGRIINLPNKTYQEWHKAALWQLKAVSPILTPVGLQFDFYFKDLRLRDLDNVTSSVLDVLKDSGLIEDDNYAHVVSIHSVYKGVDKSDPRVEISCLYRKTGTV